MSTEPSDKTVEVAAEVAAERVRQDHKWGMPQPGMRTPHHALAILVEEVGEVARAAVEMDAAETRDALMVWLDNLRAELIQVAAVAVSIVEHLDRLSDAERERLRRGGTS